VEHGEDVRLEGASLRRTLTDAARAAYSRGNLRASVCHPFSRANTGDNTPIVLHTELVPGDGMVIRFLPKGGGAENMSRCAMLSPADGREGVVRFVINAVAEAGPNPCPPILVGVGVGGSFEQAPLLAKQALVRPLGDPNPDPEAGELETELLARLNRLSIGPGGLGGDATCLAAHLIVAPCHIASLPVAVNIQCNAARRGELRF
jgi:fumarate hydratase subunit alpha